VRNAAAEPADLLGTTRFAMIIDEALLHFQMVIVDSPPVIGLADASLIAHACRNVLFVVESGRTRTRQAAESLNNLEASGAHLIGGLLTKASETTGNTAITIIATANWPTSANASLSSPIIRAIDGERTGRTSATLVARLGGPGGCASDRGAGRPLGLCCSGG
jgi:MinD-like ATPase involved in chromosome partitioning or flagellar assembly